MNYGRKIIKKPVRFKYFPFPYEIWAENNKTHWHTMIRSSHGATLYSLNLSEPEKLLNVI